MVKKICEVCKNVFETNKQDKNRIPKFCSRRCFGKTLIGKSNEKQKDALARGREYRHTLIINPTWLHNKKVRDKLRGEKNAMWKGEAASYQAKHNWIKRYFGRPSSCEFCLQADCKRFDWANISGEYKRERSDWYRLCAKCHKRFDLNKIKYGINSARVITTRSIQS